MKLDDIDRAILDGIRGSVGISDLAARTDFARTTLLTHINRLEEMGFIVRDKVFTGRKGRPRLLYRLKSPKAKAIESIEFVTIAFKGLKHLCRFEKDGWCKDTRKKCTPENCPSIIK